jgi:hypothetical protein
MKLQERGAAPPRRAPAAAAQKPGPAPSTSMAAAFSKLSGQG